MKKKRLRLRKPFRILLWMIAIVVIVPLYFPVSGRIKLMIHDYSFSSSDKIYKLGLQEELLEVEYNETINIIIHDKDFDVNKLESYLKVEYYDRENFVSNVNKLLEHKYSVIDINKINSTLSDDFLPRLFDEYIYDIGKYLDVEYFKEEYYDRYKAYFNGNYEKTILYVNIGLDKEYYTGVTINDTFSNTMLVNKYNGVSSNFVPSNLIKISDECSVNNKNYLAKDAAEAFEIMCKEARDEGYQILANSTYRDYQEQQDTWDYYYDLYGQSYLDRYVTKAGFSEHHTGLAVDVKSANSNIFEKSKEYTWMVKNSYKYGFVHRYQKAKVDITGIQSEAWHFRYVGVDVATYMYENNLCFEEYYAMFLDN